MLGTLAAPERRWLRDRKPQATREVNPEAVPTSRATVVRPEAFAPAETAEGWLNLVRRDDDERDAEVVRALGVLNRALHAQRAAAADPYVADVSLDRVLVARVGYGAGDAVADGRFREAIELPRPGARRARRSMEAPEERFAALLGGRERALVAEELVLRARADLDAGRLREAALQARVAIEALLAELGDAALAEHREAIRDAASAALAEPGDARMRGLTPAVEAMEATLRRHRLGKT